MVISSDIILKGKAWEEAAEKYKNIFDKRTHYDVFLVCTSIGVIYDKQIDSLEEAEDNNKIISVPRLVFNPRADIFESLYQTAVMTTSLLDLTYDERLKKAYEDSNPEIDKEKVQFLIRYANYGVTKLLESAGTDDLETMDNLKGFLFSLAKGTNIDVSGFDEAEIEDAFENEYQL